MRPLDDNTFKLSEVLKEGQTVEVKYLSTGCMLASSKLIEDMVKAYPDLEYDQNGTDKIAYALYQPYIHVQPSGFREYLSEDWAFCQRAIDIGYSVWADGSIKCGHWGLIKYDFEEE